MAAQINVNAPTLADIQAAVNRVDGVSSASGVFLGPSNVPIDNNIVLRTIKNMFAQRGPVNPVDQQPMNLPWAGCMQMPNIVLALRAIGVPERPLDPIANAGQIHGYSNANIQAMKNRINGVKISLNKVMNTINNQNLVNAAIAPVQQQKKMSPRRQKRYRSINSDGDSPAKKKCINDTDISCMDANWESSITEPILSELSSSDSFVHDESTAGKKQDTFCWICHKTTKSQMKCSSCFISYHQKCCVKTNTLRMPNRINKNEWKCVECETIAQNRDNEMEMNSSVTVDGLLQVAMERIARKFETFNVPSDYLENDLLVNPVTLPQILDKVRDETYNSTDEFLLDFKWLHHNINILAGRGGDHAKALKDKKKEVKCMLMESIAEIDDIRNCCDCYFNRDQANAVVMVCTKPHLVLWVQFGDHPWWPAKLLKVGKGVNPLEVQFFGDFSSADITYTNCYLYSHEDPNVWCSDTKKKNFYRAIGEVNTYIENVTQRFGSFHVARNNSKLVPGNLERYLDDMIPGYRDPSKRTSNCQDSMVDGNLNRAENGLRQSQAGSEITTIKQEPIDRDMDSDEQTENEVQLDPIIVPDVSNMLEEIEKLKKQDAQQTQMVAQLKEEIRVRNEQIRIKNEEYQAQRRHWERLLQQEQVNMINQLKDVKSKQWCSECQEMINESSTLTCQVCRLFQ